jgi:nitrogen regulatory protein PII
MKRVEAFLQPRRLAKVVSALHALPVFPGFTMMDAHGQGHGRGVGGHFVHEPNEGLLYHKRICLVVICEDVEAAAIVDAISNAARTGNKGDGLVVVTDTVEVVRIRDARGAR